MLHQFSSCDALVIRSALQRTVPMRDEDLPGRSRAALVQRHAWKMALPCDGGTPGVAGGGNQV